MPMFGSLRFLLAFMVMISHLLGIKYFQHFGYYAVVGFFILSGFLMTAGLHEVYRFDARRFWVNRAARLLPPYYLVCLLTLMAVVAFPAEASDYVAQWRPHALLHDAITDLVVLPLHHPEPHFRLVPPYWSIAIEIEMYLMLFFIAARNERLALAGFAIGLLYHLTCIYYGLRFDQRYFGAPASTLAFSLGALIYFGRQRNLLGIAPPIAVLALVAWLADTVLGGWLLPNSYMEGAGYYLGMALFAVVAAGLANADFSPVARLFDRWLGEIAYPVFLVHWLAGFLLVVTFMPDTRRGWLLRACAIPLILIMAFGLAFLSRKLIDPTRARIRKMQPAAALDKPQDANVLPQ